MTSCTTTSKHHWLGEDATISPSADRINTSAINAALDPRVWVPVAAAVLVAVTNTDVKIQNWAAENTPIFGSRNNAKDYSDNLLRTSTLIYFGSLIIAPSGDRVPTWLLNKAKGLAVGASAVYTTQFFTETIKSLSDRERPDKSNNKSFPSGHSSQAGVTNMLSSRNIEYLNFHPTVESIIDVALTTLTFTIGWARIEGNKHYPTDVLIGAALGKFFGAFINDAFLGRYSNNIIVTPQISPSSTSLNFYIRF